MAVADLTLQVPPREDDRQWPAAEIWHDPRPLELAFGSRLEQIQVSYETWGRLSAQRDNVILLCPAFSANSHAASHPKNESPGWWEGLVGPGKALDSNRYFILCPALLGGATGTTGPASLDPSRGQAYGAAFPMISVTDIVAAHIRLLDHLGIDRVDTILGGSLGAMQAIEACVRYPLRFRRAAAISGTDWTRPYTAAIHHLGRQAIQMGRAGGSASAGLDLARQIGTLFYRSREELNRRFDHRPVAEPKLEGVTFEVQSYLRHQGRKAVGRFNIDAYLTLSMAMDLHDIWRAVDNRDAALAAMKTEFLNIGVPEDSLMPMDEQLGFHEAMLAAGQRSQWRELSSRVGHDAFLVEQDRLGKILREFLDSA